VFRQTFGTKTVEGTGRWRKFRNEEFKSYLHHILSSRMNDGWCEWWACNVDGVIRIVHKPDRKIQLKA